MTLASVVVANSCGHGTGLPHDGATPVASVDAGDPVVPSLSTSPLGVREGGVETAAPDTFVGRVLAGAAVVDPSAATPVAEATAAATLTDYVLPETVTTFEPRIVITPEQHRTGAAVIASHANPDVAHVASIGVVDRTHFAVGDVGHAVDVIAVDPFTFRALTPDVTAQSPAVWERLIAGDVLVRHDVAAEFGLELGATYPLRREGGGEVLARIGAFASNGAPPFADVVVSWQVAEALSDATVDRLVLGVREGASPDDVARAVTDAAGGTHEVRRPRQLQTAALAGGTARFEPFTYTDFGDGMIAIDPAWVKKWIVRVELPRVGAVQVHRLMAPQLLAAMREVEAMGLIDHFDPAQFGGGWVPRHIDWSPTKPLSNHAWGLAVDLNTVDNCLGCTPLMDMRIVEVFRKWGFKWGGDWSRPDGMHFELERLIVPE